jgi:ribosomal protein S18 acetylase RimI-like enzyme
LKAQLIERRCEMFDDIQCALSEEGDHACLKKLFSEDGRPPHQLGDYLAQVQRGDRWLLVAKSEGKIAGYVTLLRTSSYPAFAGEGIPEINDLYIAKAYRRSGFGRALTQAAEALAASEGYSQVGLGVWEHSDGVALRLYQSLGYTLNSRESWTTPWGSIRYLVKGLASAGAAPLLEAA